MDTITAICPECNQGVKIPQTIYETRDSFKCPKCQKVNSKSMWVSTETNNPTPTMSMASLPMPPLTAPKFDALRWISATFEVFGWVLMIGSILAGIGLFKTVGVLGFILYLISGAISLLIFLAISNIIDLFLQIEKNTRMTYDALNSR